MNRVSGIWRGLELADGPSREFSTMVKIDGKRFRVRKHVNPFARIHSEKPKLPHSFSEFFANPALPLWLDIGCARGDYLKDLARAQPGFNILGLEIRNPMVIHAEQVCKIIILFPAQWEYVRCGRYDQVNVWMWRFGKSLGIMVDQFFIILTFNLTVSGKRGEQGY